MRDVAIIGWRDDEIRTARWKRLDGHSRGSSLKAIEDAGTSEHNFDSVYVGNMLAGELSHQTAIASALVDRINLIPASAERIENGPASGDRRSRTAF